MQVEDNLLVEDPQIGDVVYRLGHRSLEMGRVTTKVSREVQGDYFYWARFGEDYVCFTEQEQAFFFTREKALQALGRKCLHEAARLVQEAESWSELARRCLIDKQIGKA